MWHTYYRQWAEKLGIDYDFEVKHYSEVLAERMDVLEPKLKVPLEKTVTIHDAQNDADAPPSLMPKVCRICLKQLPVMSRCPTTWKNSSRT
ncbi:hypothetical protein [Methanohalophilus profundi]|uniref:hypothetical protein n=1 Tax=Methanohalophilus profundi TaxID=2138083 RepID=UPI002989FF2D|nr:hypothetical protein [Methanohalophilus profundi]